MRTMALLMYQMGGMPELMGRLSGLVFGVLLGNISSEDAILLIDKTLNA